jgi:hypothetical protein
MNELIKSCAKCGASKTLSCFPRELRSPDGRNRICKVCINEYSRRRYWAKCGNGNPRPAGSHNQASLLRDLIIEAYGSVCACCGESERGFLTIDHINGGGQDHVRRVGNIHRMYIEIVSEGFPKDKYRVLCWNCNAVQRYGAVCPHTLIDVSSVLEGLAC